ncbi:hypothetical protein [Nevskia ramosa]|uniref:hypothetical protein n=1 Tax=Nevskia ramosa TaxID=64002 RepID=UPI0023567DEB|nr:hypothetical protein [Nevskia ramosa]
MSAAATTTGFGGIVETAVVAVIVAVFAWRGLRQLLPSVHRRLVNGLRRVLGLEVAESSSAKAGCDSGCGTCNNCGTTKTPSPAADEAPLHFQPRKR